MKNRFAGTFLIALLVISLSQVLTALAGQDKAAAQNPVSESAKSKSTDAPSANGTSADGNKPTVKPSNTKLQQAKDAIQIGASILNVTVSVTDPYGRFVTGLGKDHFELFDGKVKQQIAHFTDDDAPVSLGIVYDVSGSMKERVGRSIRALRRFIETSHADDDFFLIGFNDRAKLVQDFTTSGDSILGHLMFASPHGSTALYDAAYIAVEKVQQGRQTKKALLIISDGQDNN